MGESRTCVESGTASGGTARAGRGQVSIIVRQIVSTWGPDLAHDEEPTVAALMRHLRHQHLLAGQRVLDLGPALNDDADEVVVRHPVTVVRCEGAVISRRSAWLIEGHPFGLQARLGLGEAVGVTGPLSRWPPLV